MTASSPALLAALAASFALSLLPWGKYALYPFRLFTTWAHECSHAAMAVLMGGKVRKITLAPDTSGLTHFELAPGRLRQAMVASAGYLGASAVGCALFFAAVAHAPRARLVLLATGGAMLASLLLWVRNVFGAFVCLALGGGMIWLGQRPGLPAQASSWVLPFLAVQTGLNSFFDLPALLGLQPKTRSDAQTMRALLWLPAGFWAVSWMALSLWMMIWTVRRAGIILSL